MSRHTFPAPANNNSIDMFNIPKFQIINRTRCTRGDARSFSVLTKRICMHKTNFLRIYSNIVLKVILICKLQLS